MNSHWNEEFDNLRNDVGSTRSDGRIKTRVSKAYWESIPGQTWSKLLKIFEKLKFDIKP